MKPETADWVEVAESDLRAARIVLDEGLLQQTVFHCQQSVEKLLKAIWTERHGSGTHPRTHNLVKLAKRLRLDVPPQWRTLLVDLTDKIFPRPCPEAGRVEAVILYGSYVNGATDEWSDLDIAVISP